MRTCPQCGLAKPDDGFYRAGSSGRMRVCKQCHIARVTKRQAERYSTDPEYRARQTKKVTKRQAERYATDPSFRLRKAMSVAIRSSLRDEKAGRTWESLVGYTVDDLRAHLEGRFVAGMTWENYGEWHIDHIIPQSAFSFSSPSDPQFAKCWALANLQPLWGPENIRKSDILEDGTRARNLGPEE